MADSFYIYVSIKNLPKKYDRWAFLRQVSLALPAANRTYSVGTPDLQTRVERKSFDEIRAVFERDNLVPDGFRWRSGRGMIYGNFSTLHYQYVEDELAVQVAENDRLSAERQARRVADALTAALAILKLRAKVSIGSTEVRSMDTIDEQLRKAPVEWLSKYWWAFVVPLAVVIAGGGVLKALGWI